MSDVKSYIPNLYGLYDMLGNAAEMTQDCWAANYQNAPTDGDAVSSSKCEARVVRGGSFQSGIDSLNTFTRKSLLKGTKNMTTGFRVALTVEKGLLDFDFKSLIE
jgi:formylglycine-generating enzyme required for sulfatase activity